MDGMGPELRRRRSCARSAAEGISRERKALPSGRNCLRPGNHRGNIDPARAV